MADEEKTTETLGHAAPVEAGRVEREAVARIVEALDGSKDRGDASVILSQSDLRAILALIAPADPADVSTESLETNTSAGRVKETAKNEHVTAPVETLGETADSAFKIASDLHAAYEQLIYGLPKYLEAENLTDEENMIREAYITLDVTAHRLAAITQPVEAGRVERDDMADIIKALRSTLTRPQPSGETLKSLAQEFEDAMEDMGHGAWAVSGDYSPLSATTVADKIQDCTDAKLTAYPSGETREAIITAILRFEPSDNLSAQEAEDLANTILALLTPTQHKESPDV